MQSVDNGFDMGLRGDRRGIAGGIVLLIVVGRRHLPPRHEHIGVAR